MQTLQKFLRNPDLDQITGLSRSARYEQIAKGKFPRPIPIGENSVGWLEGEIIEWQKSRLAEREAGVKLKGPPRPVNPKRKKEKRPARRKAKA
jgi:prophage regulatory protein